MAEKFVHPVCYVSLDLDKLDLTSWVQKSLGTKFCTIMPNVCG